ncbi:UbiX family flavin prenyltransferase [Sulfuricurvum sp. IAE1]|uniref:UbiX family flavin prenyltransferase n=1 Tax=Sulfuricurvum sp. IAE1 TaxID=2546102 RepID=UPI0010441993|nr:UbiX family flavin prenyltransferase [Sulfuricurvum sp. IAE1]TDA67403.1 UbiX family flavin prenyltransferase [Sulfuricurvum sp. IAE1]
MKIVIGISGASGAALGLKTLRALPDTVQKHLIVSEHAQIVLEKEENLTLHRNDEIWASVASGSYGADAMLITPCSMNTLAKIACGIADNLITRAAAVMIKERRTLILAPREIPFSPIALENMHKLSMMGVIIAPPVLAYYGEQNTLEEMENFMIGKWFDLLGIDNNLYKRWDDRA